MKWAGSLNHVHLQCIFPLTLSLISFFMWPLNFVKCSKDMPLPCTQIHEVLRITHLTLLTMRRWTQRGAIIALIMYLSVLWPISFPIHFTNIIILLWNPTYLPPLTLYFYQKPNGKFFFPLNLFLCLNIIYITGVQAYSNHNKVVAYPEDLVSPNLDAILPKISLSTFPIFSCFYSFSAVLFVRYRTVGLLQMN